MISVLLNILVSASIAIGIIYLVMSGWLAWNSEPSPMNYFIISISLILISKLFEAIKNNVEDNKEESSVSK